MSKLTFLGLAKKVLETEKTPLSTEEIWERAIEHGYEKDVRSQGKTPVASIGARIYMDMKDNGATEFLKIGTRPRRFALASFDKAQLASAEKAGDTDLNKKGGLFRKGLASRNGIFRPRLSAGVYEND